MSKIPWTEKTWNPVVGCTKIAPGCKNCYAERMAARLQQMAIAEYETRKDTDSTIIPQQIKGKGRYVDVIDQHGKWNGHISCCEERLDIPLHWPKPHKIFVCSMSDLFHEKVPFDFIDKVMAVITICHQHVFQILTKRPERMAEYFARPHYWTEILPNAISVDRLLHKSIQEPLPGYISFHAVSQEIHGPLPNFWPGTSISTQADADKNIPILLQILAAVRVVSLEPMLEKVDFSEYEEEEWKCDGCGEFYSHFQDWSCNHCGYAERHSEYRNQLDQVIIGCESGPGARLCSIEDIRDAVRQCKEGGVATFLKQLPINGKCNKNPKEWPEWAQGIQEYPNEKAKAP